MMILSCPWCGPRGEIEFVYGGEGGTVRPIPAAKVSDADWARYLYIRRNEKGAHSELWCHDGGCGQWFVVDRDTVTHAVLSAEKISAPPSEAKK